MLNAKKDQGTLNKLENDFRAILLEKAKNIDPWQLITKPTVAKYPVTEIES